MGIKSFSNLEIADIRKKVIQAFQEVADELLPILIEEIKDRTRGGNSIDISNFAPYKNKSYEDFKASPKAPIPSFVPNLELTGAMLASISSTVAFVDGNPTGVIAVTGADNIKKAIANQGGNPDIIERLFFGLSDIQVEEFLKAFRRRVARKLNLKT